MPQDHDRSRADEGGRRRRPRPGRWAVRAAITLAAACGSPDGAPQGTAQEEPLRQLIRELPAFDHHAHPERALAPGAEDPDLDALLSDEPWVLPLGLRPGHPREREAQRALFGADGEAGRQAKARIELEQGERYPTWVLDQLKIETMLANRIAPGAGLEAPRFRWVPFVDALLVPLDNRGGASKSPEHGDYYTVTDRLLAGHLKDAGLETLPEDLEAYLDRVVAGTLARFREQGAVAVKTQAAYLRTLDFSRPAQTEAGPVYSRYAAGGMPTEREYKVLQDYLFGAIAREAGRQGLPLHIHVGIGAGSFYDLTGSAPTRLESVLNDPELRKTRFVLIHGGWPYHAETTVLLGKPHVFTDFSALGFLLVPDELARVLRTWLEWYPEKVLFGTDAIGLSPEFGWEEIAWVSNHNGREALAIALGEMMEDGVVTEERAAEIARQVLRDNARALYGVD